jgi:phosphatidylglycerol:prolipoprotein diacylglycerol transferase
MPPRLLYAAFMLLALVVFVVTRHFVPRPPAFQKLLWHKRAALVWAVLVGTALGAKVGHALAYGSDWLESSTWLADGKTVTTGLIGAYLAVEITKLALHIPIKTGDTFALPLALAMAVGRWGCFFNGCCYGTTTDLPWGIDFGDGIRRHPTQVYESLFHLFMAGLLLWLIAGGWLRDQRLKLYLIAYGIYRFTTEFIRPEPVWALGLTFYQWVCLALIVGLAIQWVVDARPGEPSRVSDRSSAADSIGKVPS